MSKSDVSVVRPEPVFLGYCYKTHDPRPAWLNDSRVVDIASVTECNLPRPDGWIERWDFNAAGLYNTPEAAEAARVASNDPGRFTLFGYEFYPLRFDHYGNAVPIDASAVFGQTNDLPPRPKGAGFEFLGYDVVQRWAEEKPGHSQEQVLGGGFGCSPLFCNHCASQHPVNQHCLLTDWQDAIHAARKFGIDQPEPGCYYVFGVYRAASMVGPPQ